MGIPSKNSRVPALVSALSSVMGYSGILLLNPGVDYSDDKISGVLDSGSVGPWKLFYEHDFRGGDIAFFHNNITHPSIFFLPEAAGSAISAS